MDSQNNILLQKLDEFIRRYYKNKLIKGTIYSSGILLLAFLSVVFLEYFGEFNTLIRGVLFFSFLSASIAVLINYIVTPLLKLNKIGKVISYDQAAAIIGNHFSNVQDKLLNVLQLQNNQLLNGSNELLFAGINQKINELKPIPFTTAVDLNENRKYLKYLLPLVLVTTAIVIIWPQIISKSTTRLVNYQTYYEKEMPFQFTIQNKDLQALQTQDYKLEVKIDGDEVPNEVFIEVSGISYKLEKENTISFHYTFTNLQNTLPFQLSAAGFTSKEYELKVLPKPSLLQFNLQLIYPSYLNKPNENLTNTGDLQIPQGTKVNWVFNTKNTDELKLQFSDSLALPYKSNENQFSFSRRLLQSNNYTIKALNQFVPNAIDSVNYAINVIADQFPNIDVSETVDSLNTKNIYFSGQIKDDYGFSRLTFYFKKFGTDTNGKSTETSGSYPIALIKGQVSQPYFYFFDAAQYDLQQGDKVEYYFEVYDNDGVNGPKASKTALMVFKAPTEDEVNESTQKNNAEIKKDLEESIKKAKQLQKDVNDLAKKINDKKQLGYEEKKKIEDLLKKQQELQNKINEVKKENEQNNKQQSEFSQTDESILEKQKQLEQLFENVMTPEMKKLFDELNKMLEKMDKNQVQEKLEQLKLTNEDIEKELDRNLEAFKQLEVQQKMQNAIDKLDELQKKEEDLNKETEGKKPEDSADKKDKNKDDKDGKDKNAKDKDGKQDEKKTESKNLEKKQEEIKKEFDELKKDLKDLEQKNKELEEPNELPKNDEKMDEVSQDMENSSQELSKSNNKSASKSQKSASQKMKEMKEQMEKAMEAEEDQQQAENAQTLRQILENLVNLSFGQEELIKQLPNTRVDNPQYVAIPKQQNKLKDDSKIVEDSLLALSKRAPQISAIVNREINAIHLNMDKTVKALADRNTGESVMRMQSTMTSVNNLALLLNEALEQMQQQMKQAKKDNEGKKPGKCKKPGSGSGKNPSKSGTPSSSMRKLQEQLNQQLKEMKEAMEKGQKPGEKPGDKKGQKSGQGSMGSSGTGMPGSEQFAKMAAQQEALRRQMQSLMDKLKNKGNNPGGDLANLMEETEKDLVNKQITNQTMSRQQEILSRLLESEKAEREREQDEQRKSNEAKNENLSNPAEFLEYKRLKEKEMELLNTVPPSLTPYYKEKVNNYFNSLSK
ncbi:DUF4175 family protein [Aurantibacillus circumpalustris]|uniref:DUF4175 family protein n=1 Tax=Aurantibacillus circumpalustris TaxID=3036359 RepID=UPI00295B656E|nr:DUF4175 family protein [Aurantibacillus circumpalustris]